MIRLSPKGYPWLFLFSIFGLLMPFQNCAPAHLCGSNGSGSSVSASECVTESSSHQNNQNPNNSGSNSSPVGDSRSDGGAVNIITGERLTGGNGTNAGSSGSGGSGSSGGGGVVVIGGGSGGSGGGGGSGGSGGGFFDGALRIVEQPNHGSLYIGEDMELRVGVGGGKPPYSYEWFKDNKTLDTNFIKWQTLYIHYRAGYSANGVYHVVVKDSAGTSIRSANVRITMRDRERGCQKGQYFTVSNSAEGSTEIISDYLNSPAGKFLLHQQYDSHSVLSLAASFFGYVQTALPENIEYDESVFFNCRSSIPRIHTPARNPATGRTTDGDGYRYAGQINFKCRNNKLLFINKTCNWVSTSSSSGGSSSGGSFPFGSDR